MHVINELTGSDENLIKVQELVNFSRSNDLSFIFIKDWNISQRICSNSRWWTPLTWRWDRRQTWHFDAPLMTDYWPTYRSSQDLRARSSWTRSDQFHGISTLTRKSIFPGQHVHRLWKLDASRENSRKKRQRKRRIIAPITRHSRRKRKRTCRVLYKRWKSLLRCPSYGIVMTVYQQEVRLWDNERRIEYKQCAQECPTETNLQGSRHT